MRVRAAAAEWTLEQKREWVLGQLRRAVRRAVSETNYYGEQFKSLGFDSASDFTFDDFARLPTLEREHIHRAGRDLVSNRLAADELQKDSTGGSTGVPVNVWLGAEERGWRESGIEFSMRRTGAPAGARTAFFWGHHLDPVAADDWRTRLYNFQNNQRWFDCFRLSPEVLERYHRELARLRPQVVIAYASALTQLAEHVGAREMKITSYPTKCFVTGAEKLWANQRAAIEKVYAAPVHERYGSRDVGLMAMQYDPRRTHDFEVDWTNVLIEPETTEAESAILVTKFHADGMPMLRYRVGDLARFPAGSLPGHPVFTLHEVVGRDADRLWLPGGGWINSLQLPHLMKDFPVVEFQCHQHADYAVTLAVVPKKNFAAEDEAAILRTLQTNLPGVAVSLEKVAAVSRTKANKWRPVTSDVQLPAKHDAAQTSGDWQVARPI